ncbi:MAG: hypothetical protein GY870_00405 [archaeon]|nr:hypothetical protein [archaeon]
MIAKEQKTQMNVKKNEIPKFTWIVALIIGCFDLFRGFMHTLFIETANATFAHMDGSNGDLLLLMTGFGISNLITGALHIMIALKARNLSQYTLIYVPFAYLIGIISMRMNNIVATSDFLGQYIMMVYMALCIGTFIATKVKLYLDKKK